MENDGSTSSRQLRLPVCPNARTTTGVPRAGNYQHHPYSSLRPFQREPAATAAHFSAQAVTGSNGYQIPPSPLSRATHASAGGASPSLLLGGTMAMDIASGSRCIATFHSSLATGLPASSSFVDLQAASSSSLSTPPPVCQLPPLPPSLGGPSVLQTPMAAHPAGPVYRSGSSSSWMHQPYSSGNTGLNQTPWTPVPSSNTLQLGKNTITSGGSSSAWMTQPAYSSGNKLKGPMVAGRKRKLPSSPATGSGAPGSSIQYKDDATAPLFTQNEIEKIRMDKVLNAILDTNPKEVRSILDLRRNSQRSREKKAAYVSDLEHKVEQLQQETKLLSGLVNSEQSTTLALRDEKNEMIIKLHGYEKKIELMDAVNETLYAEVCRLKLAAGEIWGSHVPNSLYQEMGPQTKQQENLLIEDHQQENLLIEDHQQENLLIEDDQQENLLIPDHELVEFMHELEPLVDLDNYLA